MAAGAFDELEARIRMHHDRGELQRAAELGIRGYGGEVMGFLLAVCRDPERASDCFAELGEQLWRGLPGFTWRSSFRTWAYAIARNVYLQEQRGRRRRERRIVRASSSVLDGAMQEVRSRTPSWLGSEGQRRLSDLRANLTDEERQLLILRVDRGLSWSELAHLFCDSEQTPSETELQRVSARLRKRFHATKERLRALDRERKSLHDRP